MESLRQQCKGYTDSTHYVTAAGAPAGISPRKNRGGLFLGAHEAALSALVGGKFVALGVFGGEDAAAAAYDAAAIKVLRLQAHTNFTVDRYVHLLGAHSGLACVKPFVYLDVVVGSGVLACCSAAVDCWSWVTVRSRASE